MEHRQERTFREQLASLLNQHSKEIASDTPDFVLASFLPGAWRLHPAPPAPKPAPLTLEQRVARIEKRLKLG